MATAQDVQELLRTLTRRNVTVIAAMAQVKALQAIGLRSIQDVSNAPLNLLTRAFNNTRTAKSVQAACKDKHKDTETSGQIQCRKRSAEAPGEDPASKRHRVESERGGNSSNENEKIPALPVILDEGRLRPTKLVTNRAPLLLAFALELLVITMPEQPLSSRLSLAQGVMSLASRSKAVSLGMQSDLTKQPKSWEEGQPKISVMGFRLPVLKRGGRGEEIGDSGPGLMETGMKPHERQATVPDLAQKQRGSWTVSQKLSSRSSHFVARAIALLNTNTQKNISRVLQDLFESEPELKTATHNAWGYRTQVCGGSRILEDFSDDGESGAGAFILRSLTEAGANNTLVVVSRWFGGVMLGPDRWRLMRVCLNEALGEQMRQQGQLVVADQTSDTYWALAGDTLDETQRGHFGSRSSVVGAIIHQPETARIYLLKSFMSPEPNWGSDFADTDSGKRKSRSGSKDTLRQPELEQNLALILGALRLLLGSWAGHVSNERLNQMAWDWYVRVRPEVQSGPAGFGARGLIDLGQILHLRR